MTRLGEVKALVRGVSTATIAASRPEAGPTEADVLSARAAQLETALRILERTASHLFLQNRQPANCASFPFSPEMQQLDAFLDNYHASYFPLYTKAATALVSHDRRKAALRLLKAMPVRPDFEGCAGLLESLATGNDETARQARQFRSACSFASRGQFAEGMLGTPVAIVVAPRGNALYVADASHKKIHRFDSSGKKHRLIDGPWGQPMGMVFVGDSLFVCDYRGQAIYGLNEQGAITQKIDLRALLKGITPYSRPEYICFHDEKLYVFVSGEQERYGTIISFALDAMESTMTSIPEIPVRSGGPLLSLNGFLYAANAFPSVLYKIDTRRKMLKNIYAIPDYAYNLRGFGDHIFLCTPSGIRQIDQDGKDCCWLRPTTAHNPPFVTYDIAMCDTTNDANTFLIEYRNKAIYALHHAMTQQPTSCGDH